MLDRVHSGDKDASRRNQPPSGFNGELRVRSAANIRQKTCIAIKVDRFFLFVVGDAQSPAKIKRGDTIQRAGQVQKPVEGGAVESDIVYLGSNMNRESDRLDQGMSPGP